MSQDFYDYFPAAPQHQQWGIYGTSYGQVQVPAQAEYPSTRHPENHFLSWDKGRVLKEYQLLYISEGRGQFESDASPLSSLEVGSLLLLFPGVWHRYRPDPATGWTECWIELQGPQMENLRKLNIIDPKKPVHDLGLVPEILATCAAAGQLARTKPPGFQVRIGLLGLQILTHLTWRTSPAGSASQRIEQVVQEALQLLGSDFHQQVSPEWIARELHVGYSYFRRAFKAQTGFSPKQYRLEIRSRRACDFLRNTDLTIKEVAERLGYDSPYHLSTDFKKRMGAAPTLWRARHQPKRSGPISHPKVRR